MDTWRRVCADTEINALPCQDKGEVTGRPFKGTVGVFTTGVLTSDTVADTGRVPCWCWLATYEDQTRARLRTGRGLGKILSREAVASRLAEDGAIGLAVFLGLRAHGGLDARERRAILGCRRQC